MSSVNFQPYPYQDVAIALPERKKVIINEKTSSAHGEVPKNWSPITLALGMILVLGGVFLALAAHQILPNGVNAISQLGLGGEILSYCTIGLGVILGMIGAVKSHLLRKQNAGREATHYNAEVSEMDSYFPLRLRDKELFVVEDSSKKQITVYYREFNPEDQRSYSHYQMISYAPSSAKTVFDEWCVANPESATGASCINLETLRQRTEAFESTKTIG